MDKKLIGIGAFYNMMGKYGKMER